MRLSLQVENSCFVVVLLLILLFQAIHLSPYHGWSDDGSMYIQHAQNMLAGRPYADALPRATPASTSRSTIYPPVLPAILAPVLVSNGVDWYAMKILMMAFFVLAAIAVFFTLRPLARPGERLLVCAILFAAFEYWRITDHVNSDFLFLALLAVTFRLADDYDVPAGSRRGAVLTGLLCGFLYGTRTAGVFVPVAILTTSVWRWRRPSRFAVIASSIGFALIGVLTALTPSADVYRQQGELGITLQSIRRNVTEYPLALGGLFLPFRIGALLMCLPALYGFWNLVREHKSIWYVFTLLFLPVLVLWPFSDPYRFALPVFPILLLATIRGLSELGTLLPFPAARWALPVAAAAAAVAIQIPQYREYLRSPETGGLNAPETIELYEAIRRTTPRNAEIVSRKPRTIALYTRRRTLIYGRVQPSDMSRDLCSAGATHLVSAPGIFADDREYLEPYLAGRHLPKLFSNRTFALYDLRSECATSLKEK